MWFRLIIECSLIGDWIITQLIDGSLTMIIFRCFWIVSLICPLSHKSYILGFYRLGVDKTVLFIHGNVWGLKCLWLVFCYFRLFVWVVFVDCHWILPVFFKHLCIWANISSSWGRNIILHRLRFFLNSRQLNSLIRLNFLLNFLLLQSHLQVMVSLGICLCSCWCCVAELRNLVLDLWEIIRDYWVFVRAHRKDIRNNTWWFELNSSI